MRGIKMMMKEGLIFQRQRPAVDIDNISNLTSTSGTEATVSSGNKNIDIGAAQQYFGQPGQSSVKRKRNLPGNPDPDAEVIALSPKTLMATNRFLCEICNKGFQRDQNLQLHRRGHNLPWKLKQRSNKEVIKKKVYVCPETSCVHHEPSRALGDLTGIKKHFCRKHGEKNWKCDKCSKKYAVQSDWKAHSKTCGTREYRCDCGTLFSRRDSFITHRAFCDALAEESGRANISSSANPLLSHHQQLPSGNSSAVSHLNQLQSTQFINNLQQDLHPFPLKKEQQNFNLNPELPPWLSTSVEHLSSSSSSNLIFPTRLNQNFTQIHNDQNPNPNNTISMGPTFPPYQPAITHHMSATALLQKAAQMGSTRSSNTSSSPALLRPHQTHMSDNSSNNNNNSSVNFGLNLSARDPHMASTVFAHNLSAFGIKAAASATTIGATSSSTTTNGVATATSGVVPPSSSSILHDMMNSLSSETGFEGTSIEDSFGGILNSSKKDFEHSRNLHETLSMKTTTSKNDLESGGGGGGCINIVGDVLTRDFLGLRRLPQNNILNIDGIRNYMNASSEHQNQPQNPWQGN